MIKLDKLKKGDLIAILNPSFNNGDNTTKEYVKLKELLETRGYKTKFYPSYFSHQGYLAGSDIVRKTDINDAFSNKKVKAIICMRGGYGASRIVDKLDYEVIKNNPKIITGYSDITVLINAINKMCGFATFHGLVGFSLLGENYDSINNFWKMLEEDSKGKEIDVSNTKAETLVWGSVEGEIVGGNLTLLATLTGTPYEVDTTDKILLIEDVGEAPYRIDRYLSTLRLSGALDKAKGFILGYFTNCASSKNQTVRDLINEYIAPLNKPTIMNFPIGHSFPFVTLPLGVKVRMNATSNKITILEEIYNED